MSTQRSPSTKDTVAGSSQAIALSIDRPHYEQSPLQDPLFAPQPFPVALIRAQNPDSESNCDDDGVKSIQRQTCSNKAKRERGVL